MKNRWLIMSLILCVTLSLTSCSVLRLFSKNKNKTVPVAEPVKQQKLQIQAQNNINPNANGNASPTVVTIYELKNNTHFNSADFFSLYQNAKTALADDLVAQRQIVITPGETKQLNLTVDKDSQYIGVVAAYNTISSGKWRTNTKINPALTITVQLSGTQISIKEE